MVTACCWLTRGLRPIYMQVFVEGLLVGASRYLVKNSDKVQRRNPYKVASHLTAVLPAFLDIACGKREWHGVGGWVPRWNA